MTTSALPFSINRGLTSLAFAATLQCLQAAPPVGYQLSWADEFDGTSLDVAKWDYRTDSKHWSTQLPANVAVSGGLLYLNLKKQSAGGMAYTGAGVISKAPFRYGYYETSMKTPPGAGWHSSFWMMKHDGSGGTGAGATAIELDAIENDSISPLKYGVNTHKWNPTPHVTYGSKSVTTPSLSTGFHTYGCEFTPTTLKYYFDGVVVQTVNTTLFPHSDVNIWLTSIASYLGGTTAVDETQLPAAVQYEYARFYEPIAIDPPPVVSIINPSVAAISMNNNASSLRIAATASSSSGNHSIAWTKFSGPGNVVFSNPSSLETTATFSTAGLYVLQCAASTPTSGTGVAQLTVGIQSPVTLTLREGVDDYAHTAAIIRADQSSWNAGTRDQLLAGKSSGKFRSVFSFDLWPLQADAVIQSVSLDLKTSSQAGSGTIGNLELHQLNETPVEGTGIADGSSTNTGAGTGATWLSRTGSIAWTAPGGDYLPDLLSSLSGYDATITSQLRTLPSSPALVAAAQTARTSSQPLNLILSAASEDTISAFTRLCSDDDLTVENRPALNISFTGNALPVVSTGTAPPALAGLGVPLTGSVNGANSTIWQFVSGPGNIIFGNSSQPITTATFPQEGTYQIKLVATNDLGTVEQGLEITVGPAAITAPQPPTVVWNSPSADSLGSMPLGNGDIALNAWVEPSGDMLFYIGKSDSFEDNSRLAKVGLVRVKLTPALIPTGATFSQTLDPAKGEMIVRVTPTGGSPTEIRVWVDANHPVAEVTVEAPSAVTAAVSFEPWRNAPTALPSVEASDINYGNPAGTPTAVEADSTITGLVDGIGWYHRNERSLGPNETMQFQDIAAAPTFVDPILHRTFGALIRATGATRTNDKTLTRPAATSHRFDIHVLTQHPSTAAEWLEAIQQNASLIEALDFTARRNSHLAWWQAFWNRSHIEITPSGTATDMTAPTDVSRGYALQRYITACAGRGAYPIKFNGSLFTVPSPGKPGNADYRRWGPGYWWQNTRLPYAGLCTSGDYDLLPSLHRMYLEDVLPVARYRAQRYYGSGFADTCFMSEVTYPWGAVFTTSYGWTTPAASRPVGDGKLQSGEWHKREWVGGLEFIGQLLDDYDHENNTAFLTEKILPAALPIIRWFDRYYATDSNGKLVMYPSQSLETWWSTTNPMPEVAGLTSVVSRLLALPDPLLQADDRAFLSTFQAKIPPLPTRTLSGNTLLAPAQTYSTKNNAELPELYAVYPFRLASFEKASASQGLAAYAAAAAGDKGNVGWRQDDIFLAYLGDTSQARSRLVSRARAKDPACRFPAFWGPNFDWTPDQCHGGVLLKATQSLILQTEGDKIFLLPSWPGDWNVNFKLHAPKQTTIEGIVSNGVLTKLTVTPSTRRADVVFGSGFSDPDVAPPPGNPTSFREGVNGYSHAATLIRSDNTAWNSGARDQILIGKTSNGILRGLLSFPVTGLPTGATIQSASLVLSSSAEAGTGSVGNLELRRLNTTFDEGSGNGINSASGAGTGATWNNRTAAAPWATAGGDFTSPLLASTAGYAATEINTPHTFDSTPALVAAVQDALNTSTPLGLMLSSPATEAGAVNNFTRLASEDHASIGLRPMLNLTYSLPLNPAVFQDWQLLTWPSITDSAITGPNADPDHDGISNLLEWALALNATSPDSIPVSTKKNPTTIDFTYTRRKTEGGSALFQVEWSDSLDDTWSASGVVTDPPVSLDTTTESVHASVPAEGEKRFVRLKVRQP